MPASACTGLAACGRPERKAGEMGQNLHLTFWSHGFRFRSLKAPLQRGQLLRHLRLPGICPMRRRCTHGDVSAEHEMLRQKLGNDTYSLIAEVFAARAGTGKGCAMLCNLEFLRATRRRASNAAPDTNVYCDCCCCW